MTIPKQFPTLTPAFSLAVLAGCASKSEATGGAPPVHLLNVSYDPTRELYQEFNTAFANDWKQKTGQTVTIEQSHGGSSKQARSVTTGSRPMS